MALGYSVGRNKPYAGGFITEHYGNPASGLHTIQLELNRAIYDVPHAQYKETVKELTRLLELGDLVDKPTRQLSLGERMKCELAAALIHRPKLLILDEPLTGLDANMARAVKDALRAQVDDGAGVVVTTHILEVAERLADRIGIIGNGKLLAEGTMAELRAQAGSDALTLEDAFIRLTSNPAAATA